MKDKMLKSFWKTVNNRGPWKESTDPEQDKAKKFFNQFYLYTTIAQKEMGTKKSIFESTQQKVTVSL